jgi:Cys-tRNA(Pro)/Cys-tRNA(Cys) deacylase
MISRFGWVARIMSLKLNSMRFLESHGVPYEVATYDESIHDAVGAAAALGTTLPHVYKTLVVEQPGGKPVLIMIAADRRLNLKRFAAIIGRKKVSMVGHADAERLTGLKVGGISPLALIHKRWDVYIDRPAIELPFIFISAGERGINLRIPVADLIRIVGAKVVEATDPPAAE